MVMAAFLCGLFYGALLHAARQKARRLHSLDLFLERGMEHLLSDIRESECAAGECCGCGSDPDGVGVWVQAAGTASTSWPIPSEHGACDCYSKRPAGPSVSVGD
jgi:hypothetical protein